MEPKQNSIAPPDPNSFGSLWLANLGLLGFMEKPTAREVQDISNNHNYTTPSAPNAPSSPSLKCNQCFFAASDQATLDNHLKSAHKTKKMYPCHMCDFSTSNRGNLTYHISKHTGERPFKCEYCDHRARSAAYLKIHVRSRHTGEKPYSCPSCNFATPHSNALKSHIAAKHTGEKKYKCDLCDFSAVHSGNLKYHINAKHQEKPFKCTICDYSAGHKGNLKTHMETKHTEDKKFKCPECEYATGHQGNFKHHLKTSHGIEQLANDYIPQSFMPTQVPNPTYTSLYPYKCTQCPAYFHYPGKLVSHITEKHNFLSSDSPPNCRNEDRFKCSDCAFICNEEDTLIAHKNQNHSAPMSLGFKCTFHGCPFIAYHEHDMDIHLKTSHPVPPLKSSCSTESSSKRQLGSQFHHSSQGQMVNHSSSIGKTNKSIQCPEEYETHGKDAAYFVFEFTNSSETFKCAPCGYNTRQLEDFQLHLWASHPVDKPSGFKCGECELFALDLGILRTHMKNNHPSPCQYRLLPCPQLFYWNDGSRPHTSSK